MSTALPPIPAWKGAWRRSVSIVGVLACAMLAASVYINFRLTDLYQASSRDGAALSRLNAELTALLPRLGEATATVNRLFDDGDVAAGAERLEAVIARFNADFARVRTDLGGAVPPESAASVAGAFDAAELAFRRLTVDARQAVSYLRLGEGENALRRMAAMNRRSHQVTLELSRAQGTLRSRQIAWDARNARVASELRGIEVALLAASALVAALILLYGRRMSLALGHARRESAALAAASRASDERFAFAARSTLDGIWDLDLADGSAYYSERMLELLGLPADHPLDPRQYDELIHPEDLPRVQAARRATQERHAPYSIELRLRMPSGEYRWFHARSQGRWDESGRLVRLNGSISDISERKAGELRLTESTARLAAETSRLAAFVEHAPAAIAMFDANLRYVAASRRWMDTFLRGPREVEGQPFYEVFGDIPRSWRTVLSRVLEGEIVRCEDERWRSADGAPERHLRWEARPWHERAGSQPGVLLFAQDITRDREYEAQLERMRDAADAANRAKSEFLATMSHEIRTPMNGVLGFTQLLLDTRLDAEQREFARTIDASGRSLLALLNDILDYSKIEAGKLQVELASFDLAEVIDEVTALLSSQCREKRLELLVDYAPDAPRELLGDAARVRQVLTNLVGNAIKFTSQGHVLIEVRPDGGAQVRIAVTDTGIGIPAEQQPMLFNKFVQGDSTTTRRFGGTGLGLAICKQLIELMQGEIGVRSREGEGSTFWFTMPAPALAADTGRHEAAAASQPPATPGGLRGLRLLVVDDVEANRRIVRAHATRWEMQHDGVEDAAEALRRLDDAWAAGTPYDAAVVDYLMPGMDGEQLARRLRADPRHARLALVMLTSSAQRGELARMRAAGFDACLTKPLVRAARLQDALIEACAARRAPAAMPESAAGASATAAVAAATTATVIASAAAARQAPPATGSGTSAAAPPPERAAAASHAPILLVEDQAVNRTLVLRVLAKLGHVADVAEDGLAAVAMSARNDYRLILMDCQMPRMDGVEATIAIRAREREQGRLVPVPIVALTAGAMPEERRRCDAAGMQGFLTKPLLPAELRDVVTHWLGARQHHALPETSDSAPKAGAVA